MNSVLLKRAASLLKNHNLSNDELIRNLMQSIVNENSRIMPKSSKLQSESYFRCYINGKESNGKVDYLVVSSLSLKFTGGGTFKCNCLLLMTELTGTTNNVEAKYLIVEYKENLKINWYKVSAEHVQVYYGNYGYPDAIQIRYDIDSWKLYQRDYKNGYYRDVQLSVPYDKVNSYGVMVAGVFNFDINCAASTELQEVKGINITVAAVALADEPDLKALDDDDEQGKDSITITSSGWENQKLKPAVVLTADKESYNLDNKSDLKVSQENPYVYTGKNKSNKTAIIIGVVVAVVVVIVVVVIVVVVIKKKKAKNNSSKDQQEDA